MNHTAALRAIENSANSRSGTLGTVYEIVAAGVPRPDGAPTLRIRVLESGEALDYPLAAILDDPREG